MRVLEVRWNADREMSAECDARARAFAASAAPRSARLARGSGASLGASYDAARRAHGSWKPESR